MIGPFRRKVIRILKTQSKRAINKDFRKLLKQAGFRELYDAANIGLDALDSRKVLKYSGISRNKVKLLTKHITMVLESPEHAKEFMKVLLKLLEEAEKDLCRENNWKPTIKEQCNKVKLAKKQVINLLKQAEQKVEGLSFVNKLDHKERLQILAKLGFAFLVSYGSFYIITRKILGLPKQSFRETIKALIQIVIDKTSTIAQKILAIVSIASLTVAGLIAAKFVIEAIKYGMKVANAKKWLSLDIKKEDIDQLEETK